MTSSAALALDALALAPADYEAYERAKAAWLQANPMCSALEYEAAVQNILKELEL